MFTKIKLAISAGVASVASLAGVLAAHAQTVPTWDASSTETVVTASASAFKSTFVYVLQVIAPYAITVGLIVVAVWFFRGLGRRLGH